MRGTPAGYAHHLHSEGIIPAYAGNTPTCPKRDLPKRDHPRVCGEHRQHTYGYSAGQGSSPRMRGTPAQYPTGRVAVGIIPAYAGNTPPLLPPDSILWDHPRVCGEHLGSISKGAAHRGSSPRMRGTQQLSISHGKLAGIIPAYAGNTRLARWPVQAVWDHPRVCGEHDRVDGYGCWVLGSSPRMRGTQLASPDGFEFLRIIPAYAGNTSNSSSPASTPWDHPRVCGEHERAYSIRAKKLGSSPRMRGTRHEVDFFFLGEGIIPAYAGNTVLVRVGFTDGGDHPRVCGEHF